MGSAHGGLLAAEKGLTLKNWEKGSFSRASSDVCALGGCRGWQWGSVGFVVVLPRWLSADSDVTEEDFPCGVGALWWCCRALEICSMSTGGLWLGEGACPSSMVKHVGLLLKVSGWSVFNVCFVQ